MDEGDLLRLAASLERASEHPLAAAIVAAAGERGQSLLDASAFDSLTGKGVRGTVDGREVALGNQRLLESLGIDPGALAESAEERRAEGETVMFVALDGRPAGLIGVADPLKPTTREALDALRAEGLRIVMLTGDNRTTAEAVARRLGIEEVEAEVLPERKNEVIEPPARRRARSSRWRATASTTPRRSPRRTSGSRWAPAPTSRWRAPASRSSRATSPASCARGACRRRPCATSSRTSSSRSSTMRSACRSRPASSIRSPGLLLSPIIAAAAMSLSSVSVIGNALRLRAVKL